MSTSPPSPSRLHRVSTSSSDSQSTRKDTDGLKRNSGPALIAMNGWPASVNETRSASPDGVSRSVVTATISEPSSTEVYSSAASRACVSNHRWGVILCMTSSFPPRRLIGHLLGPHRGHRIIGRGEIPSAVGPPGQPRLPATAPPAHEIQEGRQPAQAEEEDLAGGDRLNAVHRGRSAGGGEGVGDALAEPREHGGGQVGGGRIAEAQRLDGAAGAAAAQRAPVDGVAAAAQPAPGVDADQPADGGAQPGLLLG